MQKLFALAWRNLRRNPKRNLLAGFTIFVGGLVLLCSLFLADGIADGILRNLVAIESGTVLVTYKKETETIKDPAAYAAMHQRVNAALAGLAGQERVRTRLRFDGILFGPGGESATLAVKGIDPLRETPLASYLVPASGRMLSAHGREIYLSEEIAGQLRVQPGDQITLVLNTWGNQINAMDVTLAGIFGNVAPWVDFVAYVSLPTARSLYAADMSNQYLLDTDDLAVAPQLERQVTAALAAEPVDVRSYQRAGGFQLGIANANRYTFLVFSIVLFLIVGMGIASLISITVRERGPELGMLLAIGFRGRQLIGLLVLEVLILAAIAMLAAGGTGAAIYAALASNGIELSGVARNAFGTARLVPAAHLYQLAVLVGACLGMAFLGAVVPATRILQLNTDEILRKG
jgi:ABC-type lipoprotein release transport system permease subunit